MGVVRLIAIAFLPVCLVSLVSIGSVPIASAQEYSTGGSKLHTYEDVRPDESAPQVEAVHVEDIQNALTPFLGENYVFHELISIAAHIDVLVFAPTAERDRWTFVTSGMSDKPMTVPDGLNPEQYGYAELVIAVPADWFTKDEKGMIREADLEDEAKYWPIRTLKFLARFPHEYRTWFWESHTIPNGNPSEPFSTDTKLDGVLLTALTDWPQQYRTVRAADGKPINLFAVVPLYPEEMQAKLDLGFDALLPKLVDAGVTEVVDKTRPSVAPELIQ
jgi:hypothetical protein